MTSGGGGGGAKNASTSTGMTAKDVEDDDDEAGRARGKARRFQRDRKLGLISEDILADFDSIAKEHKGTRPSFNLHCYMRVLKMVLEVV